MTALVDLLTRVADWLPFRRESRARIERWHARRLTIGPDGLVIGAQSIRLTGAGTHAALLLHGFNDTPQSMSYLAMALHRAGWTVSVPRLPGHGVSLADMARDARATRWRVAVDQAYADLDASHHHVVVCGQSMGGALAVLLAAHQPKLPALVLLAPYLGMPMRIQFQVITSWLWDVAIPYRIGTGGERSLHDPEAKAQALGAGVITSRTMSALRQVARAAEHALAAVKAPTLYLQSREDNRITRRDAERHFAMLGSVVKDQRWVSGSGHIISADYCKDTVAQQVIAWFAQHATAPSE
ncbi:MAG: alpha/beta fold hydrolase [Gemmatimonadaceae bacterium]|nr:alpha/beta fold hydrolase [Gemmatimonadaceae bacterium]